MYEATSSLIRSLITIFMSRFDSGSFDMRLKGVVPVGSWYLKCFEASMIALISSSMLYLTCYTLTFYP